MFQRLEFSSPKTKKIITLSGLSPQNVFLKKFFIFLPKQNSSEKIYIFSKKAFLIFQETKCSSPKTKKFKEGNF